MEKFFSYYNEMNTKFSSCYKRNFIYLLNKRNEKDYRKKQNNARIYKCFFIPLSAALSSIITFFYVFYLFTFVFFDREKREHKG